MKDIVQLLLDNYTSLCLIIGLGIIILINRNIDKRTNTYFLIYDFFILLLCITEIMDVYLSGLEELSMIRYFTSALGYTLRPASIVIMIMIMMRRKKVGIVLWIPIIIEAIIAFTSCFTHVMFYFGENNDFRTGSLRLLPHIISVIYLALLIAITLKMYRYITEGEIVALVYVVVICITATTIETLSSEYKFLLIGAMISSCAIYYTVLYVETYKMDVLTGLKNRRCFYMDAKKLENSSLVIVSIDMNGLKDINDLHGHGAGDKALISVGNAILKNKRKNFSAYRVGGDEFMLIGKSNTDDIAKSFIGDIREDLQANDLTASYGCALYNPGDNFDDICNRADARMYDDKRHYKHRENLNSVC